MPNSPPEFFREQGILTRVLVKRGEEFVEPELRKPDSGKEWRYAERRENQMRSAPAAAVAMPI